MKKRLSYIILCFVIPTVVLSGALIFKEKQYAWISLCVTVLSCVPFFLHFEHSENDVRRLTVIAVMVAISVIGRFIFAPIPGFKPVTATVVITAMYFGSEAGFMTGALSAVISNFYFGQGPWTPFQMFSWGIVGFIAGVAADPLKRSRIALVIYAVVFRSAVFAAYGCMDGAVGGRIFQYIALYCRRYIGCAVYGYLCRFKCGIPASICKTDRKGFGACKEKISFIV